MKFDLWPDPAEYPQNRLFCLDLLRGLDMFYLTVIGSILPPLLRGFKVSGETIAFFSGHPWFGFSMWDIIMPLFIFMAGAAVPFALGRRLGADGRPGPGYWRHVWTRFVVLWLLGMLSQGAITSLDWHQISPYSNTLQTIAVGYVVAAWLYPMRSWAVKVAVPVALVAVYALLIHFGGDYEKATNLSQKIDLAAWRWMLPADSGCTAFTIKYGYSWILPSMMFPVLSLAGCYSTEMLKSRMGQWRKAACVAALGAGSLAAGWALYFMGVKMVKHIFSASFTLQAVGWSCLLLAAAYVLTDIWKCRRGTGILLLFGQFALTAYLGESAFRGVVTSLGQRIFSGCTRFFPADFAGVANGLWFVLALLAILVVRRRLSQAGTKAGKR